MAYPTGDPLYDKQYGLAGSLLDLYDPAAEEERRKKALGQMEDVIARRYARAGETGSSVEKDALQNAAKDFSLDWSERQPTQYREAIRGSQLPIGNLLAGRTQDINKALSEGTITGYYGGAPTLARQTAGENFNLNQEKLQWLKDQSTQDLWGGLLGSVGQKSGLWDWLFPGGTGYGGGGTGYGLNPSNASSLINWATGTKSLPDLIGKGWDWITGAPAGGLGPLSSAEWTNLVSQLGPISDVSDLMAGGLFPLAGSPGIAGAGATALSQLSPEALAMLMGPSEAALGNLAAAGSVPVAGAGATVGAGLSSLALPAAVIAGLHFLTQYIDRDTETPRVENEVGQRLSSPGEFAQVMERLNTLQIGPDGLHQQSTLLPGTGISDQLVTRVLSESFGQQAAVEAALARATAPRKAAEEAVYKAAQAPGGVVPQSLAEAQGAGWNTQQWTDIFGSRP